MKNPFRKSAGGSSRDTDREPLIYTTLPRGDWQRFQPVLRAAYTKIDDFSNAYDETDSTQAAIILMRELPRLEALAASSAGSVVRLEWTVDQYVALIFALEAADLHNDHHVVHQFIGVMRSAPMEGSRHDPARVVPPRVVP